MYFLDLETGNGGPLWRNVRVTVIRWGHGSVGKVLASQAWGPEFRSPVPI